MTLSGVKLYVRLVTNDGGTIAIATPYVNSLFCTNPFLRNGTFAQVCVS